MPELKFPQPILIITLLLIPSFISGKTSGTTNSGYLDENQIIISDRTAEILEDGMYVILGSFRIETNAIQYAQSLEIEGKMPQVGKDKVTELYYVYAYKSKDDLQFVREKRAELRATSQFFDAWILYVGINLDELLSKGQPEAPDDIQTPKPVVVELPEPSEQIAPSPAETADAYQFQLKVINAATLREVSGNISILDAESKNEIKSVRTNETHTIYPPENETREIILLCDIVGFVKEQVVLKIDDPMNSPDRAKISLEDGVTTVTFALSRPAKVGEKFTLYNVYFYTDAAIMKPGSESALNSLLAMLMENEKLEIRIHGHTNGSAAGRIISLKDDDDNFFKITNDNIKGFGTAKKLSRRRAEIVMRWLMAKGIEKSRMEIKAWGGQNMIYDKNSFMAEKNVRVEIEILKI